MPQRIIEYSAAGTNRPASVMIDKIVRLSKKYEDIEAEDDVTLIHLTTGEILVSDDSIRTLSARINLAE